tara:strand:- start:1602 stop:1853 length:252 start_codon:yes stop_codon:yes gene_type:complete
MNEEWNEYPAPAEDALKLNTQRSTLILWIVERFQTMLAEGREGDACHFMDEWFEWMDKDTYINESTLFFDENELKELYESVKG